MSLLRLPTSLGLTGLRISPLVLVATYAKAAKTAEPVKAGKAAKTGKASAASVLSSRAKSGATSVKLVKVPTTKKASVAKTSPKEAKAQTPLELLDAAPTRSVIAKLKQGTVTTPKPHWAPIPTPPSTPYIMFFKEVSKDLAEQWKNLPVDERKKYDDLAAADKKRFEKESQEFFQKRAPDQFYQQKLPAALAKIDPLKPPKGPPSSFALFVQHMSKENPSMGMKELSAICGNRWGALSESEKKVWQDKASELKDAYAKEMELYKKKLPKEN